MELLLTIVFLSMLAFVGVSMIGAARWSLTTRTLRARLEASGRQRCRQAFPSASWLACRFLYNVIFAGR